MEGYEAIIGGVTFTFERIEDAEEFITAPDGSRWRMVEKVEEAQDEQPEAQAEGAEAPQE
jgi:hypothetical protein